MATLSLFADLAQLATIRGFLARAGHDLELDDREIYDLQLAVDEACSNVVKHGYGGQGGEIEITIEREGDRVRVTIRDWGRAFVPQSVPTPDVTASLDQRRLGGLGLFLIHQVMDDVHFEFDAKAGNVLTMVKQVQGREKGKWT
jgi:serine/threonine-protein kinase RsbW